MSRLASRRIWLELRRAMERQSNSVDDASSPFAVTDATGSAVGLVNGTCDQDPNAPTRTYTLVYKPGKDEKGPVKLVYRDRRSAFVEVPFTLHDVPLYKDR